MASQWYDNFPAPRSSPRSMTDIEIAALITNSTKSAGKDYIVVDVRRTDFGTNMVRTAVNIPAQSFYYTRSTWVKTFGFIPLVIFYCSSSNGRGPRCAGWFQDALDDAGNRISEAIVLAGGIKQWEKSQENLTDPVLQF